MVSVCRLPSTGKCWASAPRSLAPASLLQAAQEPRAGESVLRACVVRVHCVTICVLCVCVCCLRVSVDTSNSMAQTSRPTADPRPSSSPKVDLNQVQSLASCFSHPYAQELISGLGLCCLLLGWGSVWPKQQTSWRLLELAQATPAEEPQPCLCLECVRGDTVAHVPLLLVSWLSLLRGFSPL